MNIGIRADGGQSIGMGHIMRTLVLAEELAKKNNVFYICKFDNSSIDKYKSGMDAIKAKGFNVVTINEDNFIEELCKVNADCLITDSYNVSEEYFNITKQFFKITGYIDDMDLYHFNVDFIINQNVGAEEYLYSANRDSKLLTGSNYIMLRKEFRNYKGKAIDKEVSDIMITVGGADANGITNIICDYVKELEYQFHIVIGPAFDQENIDKLIDIQNTKDNIKLYFNANMIEIMNKCDLAISTCGSTLYELAACGVPTLGMVIADNQRQIAEMLERVGFIKNLGWYNRLSKEYLVKSVFELNKNTRERKKMSKKGLVLVDGKGVKRIANVLNEYNRMSCK